MIKYYCDRCNEEIEDNFFKDNRMYKLTIISDNALFYKAQLCEKCKDYLLEKI